MKKLINASPNDQIVTSQDIVTSVGPSATDQQIPSALAVKTAIEQGGGGTTGYTVTVANDFIITASNQTGLATAPLIIHKTDGTTQTIDLATSPRGTIVADVVSITVGEWTSTGENGFRQCGVSGGRPEDCYIQLSTGRKVFSIIGSHGSTSSGLNDFTDLRASDSFLSTMFLYENITISELKYSIPCILRGTIVRLADGQDKAIEEITYDDELLVWDFDNGKLSSAKPLWIKKSQTATYYFRNILSSGKELLTTGQSSTGWGHRMFDIDEGQFRYTTETVSDRIFTLDGVDLHKSCERIEGPCEHYNIITDRHFNLFANGILTSCSYNNLYPIKDMKFVKDNRHERPFEAYDVPLKYYKGMRLSEQTIDPSEVNRYVNHLIDLDIDRK